MWRTRRWARDLPDLVLVVKPFERWSALGRRRSRPACAAPLQGTARPTVAACTAQLATAQPARHRNTARRDSVRVGTTRRGTARPSMHGAGTRHGTRRDGTARRGKSRPGTGRDWTGLDWTVQRDSAGLARCGTPIPTQDGTAGLGTTRHTRPGTGGRASLGTPRTAQEGTASLGITAHPARRGVASQPGTSRHRRSAIGDRRSARSSARHRSPRRINITHQRQNAPSRERRGVLVYPGVSRW